MLKKEIKDDFVINEEYKDEGSIKIIVYFFCDII
ncbi:hypothetical protein BJV85_000085 [Clostridium acetobutylicum]|nr:hypothetical protein [Clostridium acetobutylicum]NOW14540.1 hypothetical protein [Clostridium acetobutylicum]NRY58555.1 hypothetical protein [Clostridium acetobutylicum]NSA91239.1 hypothetical protein [Clostridium acetobutylicum]NYC92172.1 hypothetical protein [Clostridium acetobutylicum]